MAITFSKLGLKSKREVKEIKIGDVQVSVRQYLPIDEKTKLIQFIVNNALDESTGCFSPIRVEVYFSIGICKWYANIIFTDKQMKDVSKTYDLLEENSIIDLITSAIDKSEIQYMNELVNDTVKDISRYNSSAAGIIQMISSSTGDLDKQVTDVLEKIKNSEGLEQLAVIKDAVGTD